MEMINEVSFTTSIYLLLYSIYSISAFNDQQSKSVVVTVDILN